MSLPPIDGRNWLAAEVQPTTTADPIRVPGNRFSLRATDCGDHGGDFERCRLWFRTDRTAPVRIGDRVTGWVFVTPDVRYVVTEPLTVLDTREWRQYDLSEALNLRNYISIRAISRDGRRLLVSRQDCGLDCAGAPLEHFEVTWP